MYIRRKGVYKLSPLFHNFFGTYGQEGSGMYVMMMPTCSCFLTFPHEYNKEKDERKHLLFTIYVDSLHLLMYIASRSVNKQQRILNQNKIILNCSQFH